MPSVTPSPSESAAVSVLARSCQAAQSLKLPVKAGPSAES